MINNIIVGVLILISSMLMAQSKLPNMEIQTQTQDAANETYKFEIKLYQERQHGVEAQNHLIG